MHNLFGIPLLRCGLCIQMPVRLVMAVLLLSMAHGTCVSHGQWTVAASSRHVELSPASATVDCSRGRTEFHMAGTCCRVVGATVCCTETV